MSRQKELIKMKFALMIRFANFHLELNKYLHEFYQHGEYNFCVCWYRLLDTNFIDSLEIAKQEKEFLKKFDNPINGIRGQANLYLCVVAKFKDRINYKIIEEII